MLFLVGAFMFAAAVPAFGNMMQRGHTFTTTETCPVITTCTVNGYQFVTWVQTSTTPPPAAAWGPKFGPGLATGSSLQWGTYSMGWAFSPKPWTTRVTWGQTGLLPISNPSWSWFTAKQRITWAQNNSANGGSVKKWHYKFGYTSTAPAGYIPGNQNFNQANTVWVNGASQMQFIIASPPTLWNPDEILDGNDDLVANTSDMVIRNVKYAQSPAELTEDDATLDNPAVQALFDASPDATRTGPFLVAPGEQADLAALPPSIGDAEAGGQTLLMKGEVEGAGGEPVGFLIQSIVEAEDVPPAPPAPTTPTPASSWWSLAVLLGIALAIALSNKRIRDLFQAA